MNRLHLIANTPLTEDQIERAVERSTDRLDAAFLDGKMTKEAYDANCAAISEWADREYARTRAQASVQAESGNN